MSKLQNFKDNKQWIKLSPSNKTIIVELDSLYILTHSEIQKLISTFRDFEMWDEPLITYQKPSVNLTQKQQKKFVLEQIFNYWEELKKSPNDYSTFTPLSDFSQPAFAEITEERTILGQCPVASPKTRCCNLKTLDAVESCGFDCSYCSIQSFYSGGTVKFDKNFRERLTSLELDPSKRYHIGTGQSSDSLMWGNKYEILESLSQFARNNPNVVLEYKTKSKNIHWLLENDIPKNIICTWSVNPQIIIDNEEHLTVSLEERLEAARKIADKGTLVGFHFHPMVYYKGWEEGYGQLIDKILERFSPNEVITISLGTLTFIKPVIKKLRSRDFKSKILQMPLVDAEGKQSYPYDTKKEMFSFVYNRFKQWHNKVFFYMCMEDIRLWNDVFGYEYNSNDEFEEAMLNSYFRKINSL